MRLRFEAKASDQPKVANAQNVRIELDGVDISRWVRDFSLSATVHNVVTATIEFYPSAIDIEADTHIVVKRPGWLKRRVLRWLR